MAKQGVNSTRFFAEQALHPLAAPPCFDLVLAAHGFGAGGKGFLMALAPRSGAALGVEIAAAGRVLVCGQAMWRQIGISAQNGRQNRGCGLWRRRARGSLLSEIGCSPPGLRARLWSYETTIPNLYSRCGCSRSLRMRPSRQGCQCRRSQGNRSDRNSHR